MARAAYQMALASRHVRADIVEVSEFPQLAQRYKVRAVPATVIDDKVVFPGAVPPKVLVEMVLKTADSSLLVEPGQAGDTTPTEAGGRRRTSGSGLILP